MEERLITVKEAAKMLGLSPTTIYIRSAPKAKRPLPIKPIRLSGRCVRFRKRDIENFIKNC